MSPQRNSKRWCRRVRETADRRWADRRLRLLGCLSQNWSLPGNNVFPLQKKPSNELLQDFPINQEPLLGLGLGKVFINSWLESIFLSYKFCLSHADLWKCPDWFEKPAVTSLKAFFSEENIFIKQSSILAFLGTLTDVTLLLIGKREWVQRTRRKWKRGDEDKVTFTLNYSNNMWSWWRSEIFLFKALPPQMKIKYLSFLSKFNTRQRPQYLPFQEKQWMWF